MSKNLAASKIKFDIRFIRRSQTIIAYNIELIL